MVPAYQHAMTQYGQSGPLAHTGEQSPWQLVEMLLSGALQKIAIARRAAARQDVAARGEATSRAMDILGYLDGILDRSGGGALSGQLSGLYSYAIARLLQANAGNDDAAYQEVAQLVGEIKNAWDALPGRLQAAEAAA